MTSIPAAYVLSSNPSTELMELALRVLAITPVCSVVVYDLIDVALAHSFSESVFRANDEASALAMALSLYEETQMPALVISSSSVSLEAFYADSNREFIR